MEALERVLTDSGLTEDVTRDVRLIAGVAWQVFLEARPHTDNSRLHELHVLRAALRILKVESEGKATRRDYLIVAAWSLLHDCHLGHGRRITEADIEKCKTEEGKVRLRAERQAQRLDHLTGSTALAKAILVTLVAGGNGNDVAARLTEGVINEVLGMICLHDLRKCEFGLVWPSGSSLLSCIVLDADLLWVLSPPILGGDKHTESNGPLADIRRHKGEDFVPKDQADINEFNEIVTGNFTGQICNAGYRQPFLSLTCEKFQGGTLLRCGESVEILREHIKYWGISKLGQGVLPQNGGSGN
jgi:hypothetical protein